MKLQLKRTQIVYAPNWHPNFRDSDSLPDLKVVRTSFFVNFACIVLATAALLFTAYREYNAAELRGSIQAAEDHVAAERDRNAELLKMNREFSDAVRKFNEADAFLSRSIVASDLLVALGRSLPGNMDFTSVAYENDVLTLRGVIRGASDSALTRLTAYLDVLRQDEIIRPNFPNVELLSSLRDPRTQGLSFEILLKPAPPPANAAAKKA